MTTLSDDATIGDPATGSTAHGLERVTPRRTKVGLVAGGLGAYWPQFPDLLPQLQRSAARVSERMTAMDCDVVDVGFISDADDGARAAEQLRAAGCDLIVSFLATYLTASMLLPIAQRSDAPILVINLQPTEAMDHATFDTGQWLAYCGACPLPEMANAFLRAGVSFRSVSGYLEDERAWLKIGRWVTAAGIRGALRHSRHGLMGHLYPGMLDVSTDLTMITTHLGGHVEVLEVDDLRVRVATATDTEVRERIALARDIFDVDPTVQEEDLAWGAKVSVGLDKLVDDFGIDSLAYYHRGLEGEQHERIGAGMILGASLLTARGIPAVGEYELRTSLAMLIVDRLGGGGSFTEFQALNFDDDVVEMGHDGPAHLAISEHRPLLRGLGVFHGKRGWGVSVEFDVQHGPVTTFGISQRRDGTFRFIASAGKVVPGPVLQIGNTTSRVDFGCDPGEWADAWSASGISHHWALGVGNLLPELRATAELLDIELVEGRAVNDITRVPAPEVLAKQVLAKQVLAKEVLARQAIELPSWAFGNSGTRFKVFAQPGVPRDPYEKIADAAQVHRFTGAAPTVALHIPWDKVDDYELLRKAATDQGIDLGTINANVFQDDDYKLGSVTNPDPRIRQKALDHLFDCVDVMDRTGSRDLKLWFSDGTNYPGQDNIRARQDRLADALAAVYERLTGDQRLILEYKLFEPAFYTMDVPDWGTSFAHCLQLGERAKVCVDTGHHAPGTNIEFIVAFLLRADKLGAFDFNSRFYADDDLMVGSADPFQLFRILFEVMDAGGLDASEIAFMLDQCHNIEPKIPGQIRSVMNVQEATAKALLVDSDALDAAQSAGDVLGANAVLMDAYNTDVRPLLAELREEQGLDPDPMGAYAASGYAEQIVADRVGGAQAGWGA